jgi:class 3 adenylate cyclase/tetratricopeptide (TPR) repeat protein
MRCAKCQQENPPRARFCIECAAPLARSCGACGAELPATARFCPQCAEPVAPPADRGAAPVPRHLAERILESRAALEGERKQVTVLFADIKGSTEMLADRDPEEARRILDPVLQRMMDAVHRYEGTVNQVMGDGIMALFGAPLALEDHAMRACFAALRMQEAILRGADEARRAHGIEVQVRVGLNSGEVVVRSIGSDLRMDYTAVGQTTHLAARMEQFAPAGTTRMTASTLALAEGYVDVKPLGAISLKGIAEPVVAYELLGAADARTRLQARRTRGLTRFIGRDAEMEQLRTAAAQARRGQGQIVAVVGEPGVGKSRLYHEFTRSHHVQGWRIAEASSVSYGKASAFLPVANLLRDYFAIDRRDDLRAIRAKTTGAVLTLDEALRDAVPAALWLLDALPQDHAFAQLDSAQRRRATLEALKRLLLRESQVQPLLLVFEDLHWIDAETQAFLDLLADGLPATALLLAVNYRPEYRHDWAGKTYYRQLRIDPLAPQSAESLLRDLLGPDPSLCALERLLAERTQGNPLYIEESVRTLVETGALEGGRGAYRLARSLDALAMPASVQAILAARIDRLQPDDKRLLQAAAVVGMDVPYVLLRAVAGLDEDALRGGLARLQAAEFIYEARLFPDLEYTFKHALTLDVAYGGVLGDRRRALHGAIVAAVERLLDPERRAQYVERLAHHAVLADDTAQALRYLRLAGAKAAARFANREAVAYYEQALALLAAQPETPERLSEALDIQLALGPALMPVKGEKAPEIEALYLRMQQAVERLDERRRRFPVVWGLWRAAYSTARFDEALERGERLLASARDAADSGELVEAHHTLWPTLMSLGRTREAQAHIERGIALYDPRRHAGLAALYSAHDPGVCCRIHLGMTRWIAGYPDQAARAFDDARRLNEEVGNRLSEMIAGVFAGWVHLQRGDRGAASAHAQAVIELCGQYGVADWAVTARIIECAASAEAASGERLRELAQANEGATAWRRSFGCVALSDVALAAGWPELARELLEGVAIRERSALFAPEVDRIEGCLSLAEARTSDAERHFRHAVEVAHAREARSFELRSATQLARLLETRGRRDEAREVLGGVYRGFVEGFDTADLRTARSLLDALG